MYGLQYSDKTSLSSGVVFGLVKDTHLVGNQYANLTSFFYMAYGVAQIPMGYLMQRFPLGRALSVCIVLWGGMVMLLAACNNYAGLAAVRTFLGWFEAVVTPGFAVLTASWYLRSEQTLRQGMYYAMSKSSTRDPSLTPDTFFGIIFGIGIYFLALNAETHGGLAAWRVINLFLGGTTVGMGLVAFAFIGTPSEVWWLSKREKRMAHARIVQNATGGGEQHSWKWEQVRECFGDRQFIHAILYNFLSCVPNGGLGAFQVSWSFPTRAYTTDAHLQIAGLHEPPSHPVPAALERDRVRDHHRVRHDGTLLPAHALPHRPRVPVHPDVLVPLHGARITPGPLGALGRLLLRVRVRCVDVHGVASAHG